MDVQDFGNCRQRYSGSVILLASGPSTAEFPLKRYAGVPVLAMNGSILRCTDEGIVPFFYLCDDPGFVRNRPVLARQGASQALNLAMSLHCFQALHGFAPDVLSGKSLYLLERANRMQGQAVLSDRAYAWSVRKDPDLLCGFSLLHNKPNRIGFSFNMGKGYFGARTIPYASLQLALHLGFSQVFIVGMDLNTSLGRFYEAGEKAIPSTLDEDYDDYILPSFALTREKAFLERGVRVFNLSANSRLPHSVVPKISMDEMDSLLGMSAVAGREC